ncbi:hypothetical protein [Streptomyces sp. NPDC050392]|uniref:hypothetical protein n=1 Tax=Streptomyces sp. NPDC050392 TaxID=3155782 RepID=UPI00342F1E1D
MGFTLDLCWMTRNGEPAGCPECLAAPVQFTVAQFVDGWPSRGWCPSCYHSWDDLLITNAVVRQIAAESTGRQRAADDDTFAVAAPGQYLEGERYPEVTVDDLHQITRFLWRRGLKPDLRRRKNAAKRSAKTAVKGAVGKAASAPLAAALRVGWQAQAGGWEEDPDGPDPSVFACPAGCDKGWFDLDTHLHELPRVMCSVCKGTGDYAP